MSRKFEKMIFGGAGDHTKMQLDILRDRFEECIAIMGGLQQPGHPDSEEA